MLPIGAVVVDFDGTVCLHDVGVDLLARFGTDASRDGELAAIDRAFEAGAIGLRDVLEAEAATLRADDEELIGFALAHCPIDPTFAPFAAWAADRGAPAHGRLGRLRTPRRAAPRRGRTRPPPGDHQRVGSRFARVRRGPSDVRRVRHLQEAGGRASARVRTEPSRSSATASAIGSAPDTRMSRSPRTTSPSTAAASRSRSSRTRTSMTSGERSIELDGAPGPVGGEPCPGWREPS